MRRIRPGRYSEHRQYINTDRDGSQLRWNLEIFVTRIDEGTYAGWWTLEINRVQWRGDQWFSIGQMISPSDSIAATKYAAIDALEDALKRGWSLSPQWGWCLNPAK